MDLERSNKVAGWLLVVLVLAHLIPIWGNAWFVTLDGPCHLYNARILRDLITGDEVMASFFKVVGDPVPYWSGQLLMAGLLTALPPALVEKVTFTVIVIGMAWSFHRLCRLLAPGTPIRTSLLVMPFLLHYAVSLGFINFSLSIPILLGCLAWCVRRLDDRASFPVGVLLFTLLYFTHLSSFLLGVGAGAALIVRGASMPRNTRSMELRHRALRVLPAMAPGLLLATIYVATHGTMSAQTDRLPFTELLLYVPQGRSWNALGLDGERLLCTLIAIPMLVLGAMAVGRTWRRPTAGRAMAWTSVGLLLMYFALPDVVAGGSSASPRLLLFAMLFLALTIASTHLPGPVLTGAISLIVVADLVHLRLQLSAASSLSSEVSALLEVQGAVEPGAVVHPVRYDDNWMHSNINNYLGAVRGTVMLDNFVATAPFAPVQWRNDRDPAKVLGQRNISDAPCVRIADYGRRTGHPVRFVLTWQLQPQRTDSCANGLRHQLTTDFIRVSTSLGGRAVLYEHR